MSEPVPLFSGRVEHGRLHLDEPSRYNEYIKGFEGKTVIMSVRRHRKNRSLEQNRYYWGVVIKLLADGFGYETEEMHDALKFQFLRVPAEPGRPLETVRSTASLTTVEFMDYIAAIQRWAATEFCIFIPDPGQVEY